MLFFRRYSIATPSLLHRYSIVSMEYLWTYDGEVMEQHKRNEVATSDHQNSIICYLPTLEDLIA